MLLAAGTAFYDYADFIALDNVPDSLGAVVAALTNLGFATFDRAPGYLVDPVLADLRAAVRKAAAAVSTVIRDGDLGAGSRH